MEEGQELKEWLPRATRFPKESNSFDSKNRGSSRLEAEDYISMPWGNFESKPGPVPTIISDPLSVPL